MSKVVFTFKNGRSTPMAAKLAEHLQRVGKGTYQTTAVQQAPQRAVLTPAPTEPAVVATLASAADHEPENEPTVSQESVTPLDLSTLTVDELRELAKQRGAEVHHRAGPEKIIAAIEKKAAE